MNVKRYEWVACDEHACHCDVVESAEGDMVDYEDYAALEQKLIESDRYGRQADITIENLQMQVEKLAAENAGLKDEISNITFMRDDDFFGSTQRAQEVMGRLVNVKTPATDAFLAEVRAQGVEMCSAEIQKQTWDEREGDGMVAAIDAMEIYAAQLRKGVQS